MRDWQTKYETILHFTAYYQAHHVCRDNYTDCSMLRLILWAISPSEGEDRRIINTALPAEPNVTLKVTLK